MARVLVHVKRIDTRNGADTIPNQTHQQDLKLWQTARVLVDFQYINTMRDQLIVRVLVDLKRINKDDTFWS